MGSLQIGVLDRGLGFWNTCILGDVQYERGKEGGIEKRKKSKKATRREGERGEEERVTGVVGRERERERERANFIQFLFSFILDSPDVVHCQTIPLVQPTEHLPVEVAEKTWIHLNKHKNTVYTVIFARRKFSPISPSALFGKIFITQIFCPVLMIK